MQLYALDEQKRIIAATKAERQADYFCLECGATIRLRSGPHRQAHFFHLFSVEQCRQNGKSLAHLQAQRRLEQLLGPDQCRLEQRFSPINRIADVVWEPMRIVFEVQCSGISAEEVQQRNRDYQRMGYRVVWLLHDNQFNRYKVSAAEMSLRHSPHYFTNINAEGEGDIYDQFDIVTNGLRSHRLPKLRVDLAAPVRFENDTTPKLRLVEKRLECFPGFFAGDLADLCLHNSDSAYLAQALPLEPTPALSRPWWHTFWQNVIVEPYIACLHTFLEKLSK